MPARHSVLSDGRSPERTLAQAVSVNEDIKRVIDVSRQVNLVAVNAMLVAKRAGIRSAGFGVVSAELGAFSHKLEEAMSNLRQLIFGLVKNIAAMQKAKKLQIQMRKTLARCGDPAEGALPARLSARSGALLAASAAVEHSWSVLHRDIRQSLSLCALGNTLSRNAKIEAAYGGDRQVEMNQVALKIEETVNDTLTTLKQLNVRLDETRP